MTHQAIKPDYEYDSLEPFIDKETMQIHFEKHHQGYANKLNNLLEKFPELKDKPTQELLKNINKLPDEIKQKVINLGGGVFNHNFFWPILKKDSQFDPDSEIGKEIISTFESFEKFKEQFSNSAMHLFGSGWAWLVLENNKLKIIQTKNQDSPISKNQIPLIALDVWEHAYYLKYQSNRTEYIKNFWEIINWKKVNELFLEAKS
jgi:Fe-Mn family superoxide dismutase